MKEKPNLFIVLITIIAGFGGFLLGFDSTIMADAHDQIVKELNLSNWQWSQVISISLFGSIFGIPISGFFADRISRRLLLQLIALGFIVSIIGCALSSSFSTLLVGRFFSGICVGVAAYATPLFIAEMAIPERRGALLLINGLTLTFGQAMAYLVGYMVHDYSLHSWRFLLLLASIPGGVLLLGMYLVPHAPGWVVKKKGIDSARVVLKRIRPRHYDIEAEIKNLNHSLFQQKVDASSLLKKPILYVVLLGTALGVAQQCSGINSIMYYGPMLFAQIGFFPIKNAILATFCLGFINFLFTIVTLVCVDKLGRRFLLLNGTLLASISLFIITALLNGSSANKFSVLFFFSLYVAGYCVSVGSLFWVLISEIYPIQVRGLAMSIATVIQYLVNFIISLNFLSVYQTLHQYTFLLFGLFCCVAFLLIYFFVPETTGVPLSQIEERLMARYKIREIGHSLRKTSSSFIIHKFR
ncbi:sugar porter family MFS transporter [Legionella sp. km772]|uniref:sugar porter family MFS transporter n=1 Tax=Legionella sp. km772 TaxID=2498111 RepID=UPI000F8F738A|nr:sugar porter family MFS transporter [Legionella sp. km772]RUR12490.1 MFS transporter [Legionella sp. km772]